MSVREIAGDRVVLRPVDEAEEDRYREILAEPEVARWWGDPDEEVDLILDADGDDAVFYAIVFEGAVIGIIQYAEETYERYHHAGIDIALDPGYHGKGLGTEAIQTLARYLIEHRGHHRFTIDPDVENTVAIAAFSKAGFKPVGVLRQYEQRPDGTYGDALLMDLLADELA